MSTGSSRRFWTSAETQASPDGYRITLDGRPVRLPDGAVLECASAALAAAVAQEWNAVGETYGPDDLGLTRLAGTMLHRQVDRETRIAGLLRCLDGDTLCYRVARPSALAAAQSAGWQPWLDWLRDRHEITLATTDGILPLTVAEPARVAMHRLLERQDPPTLIALGVLAPALSSLVLGLAVVEDALDAASAFELSQLEASSHAERWGHDREASAALERLRRDCIEAERFLHLARDASVPTRRLLIAGRVQGVGYRIWLRRTAMELGVRGWVRNRDDGRVEALIQGDDAALHALTESARSGPSGARVGSVEAEAFGITRPYEDFTIEADSPDGSLP